MLSIRLKIRMCEKYMTTTNFLDSETHLSRPLTSVKGNQKPQDLKLIGSTSGANYKFPGGNE